jgi:hypothetical protein
MHRTIACSLALVAALGFTACSEDDVDDPKTSAAASSYDADVATAWFDLLYSNLRDAALPPTISSRNIGYTAVTAYEAIVPGMADHRSLGGQLNELPALPDLPTGEFHWPTVLNTAVAQMQRNLFATAPQPVLDAIDALEADVNDDFTLAQAVLDRSVDRGLVVADAIWTWSQGDGFATLNNCPYTPPVGPGLWVPTPPAFAAPHQPCWGDLRPFVLLFGAECSVLPPLTYSTDPASPFYLEALEVYDTVNNLTPEQLAIAQFWADNPTQTGTPPGHWVRIVSQVAEQYDLQLDVATEAYARVGIGVADAFISCWSMKYIYNYLRPITFIQDPAGINDPAWTTAPGIGGGIIATPAFPEYTSGHSTQSGAVAFLLTDLLGDLPFVDDTHAGLGLPARSFDSFDAAAEEAAISRIYAGIHFRTACERGIQQGKCVGDTIQDEIEFLQ